MGAKRDVVAEIEEIRSRTLHDDWDNGITKMFFLYDQTRRLEQEDEQQAYFLVASVAAIETFFRWQIRNILDSGNQQYISNLRLEEHSLRWTHDLLVAVHGKRVSVGELIAHSVGLNNLEAVGKIMGQLLQTDFFELVKQARNPETRRAQGSNAPPIIQSPNETLAHLKRTFELRHIICHEAHVHMKVSLDEVKDLCSSCYTFLLASNYGIAYYTNPAAPLTLDEAYDATDARVKALETEMTQAESLITARLSPPEHEAFFKMQEAWRLYVEREAAFNVYTQMNGNRGMLHGRLAAENLYAERLHKIKAYAKNSDPQAP